MATGLIRQGGLAGLVGPRLQALGYFHAIRRAGHFDRGFYRAGNPDLHSIYRALPEWHYVLFGEREGRQPSADFSPQAYLRQNPDLSDWAGRPYLHFLRYGRQENRPTRDLPGVEADLRPAPVLRPAGGPRRDHAIVVHVYYHDLWPEIAERLAALDFSFDLYVTVTDRGGDDTEDLAEAIRTAFPGALAVPMPNRGRDIFPFVHLVNSGLLDSYRAVAKIHTKKSPHRSDGGAWRRRLIDGILPETGAARRLAAFLADPEAGIWAADGQLYRSQGYWGENLDITAWILRRIGIRMAPELLGFPAGSMYWLKPVMIALIRGFRLEQSLFEAEYGQVDGTLAHAFERAVGFLAQGSGLAVRETKALMRRPKPAQGVRAGYVSAFYLPQYHRVAENDAWWGPGYTEWQAAAAARPMFDGHPQPALPGELGFYDLNQTEVMGEQAALARWAGIDAFCVYHYWFDGRRLLEAPMARLLGRPEIDFPFYLCWANESWRRNWDGLSGEVLIAQGYREGFEEGLAVSTLPYMRDPRYQRPDGQHPRFVIYRPEEMPEPARNVARLRAAWKALGIGEVELGAVRFHVAGAHPVPDGLFDFWVEMPPHGLVAAPDYLYGGPQGNLIRHGPVPGFRGLIYDYDRVVDRSLSPDHAARLPANTIAGAMPGWDNTARRGLEAHIAHGAHPGAFARWLGGLSQHRLAGSYRHELMLNAWNEWGERAILEPDRQWGRAWLEVVRDWR
jgi:lipopolysaccharide biosynthesis protein